MKSRHVVQIKLEKPNLIKLMSNQSLLKNPNIFRVFEIFLILAVISRLPFQIQPSIAVALTLSREYLHTLSLFLVSPPFVFILGNAIVITLFVNSPNYHIVERPKSPSRDPRKKVAIAGEETIMTALFAVDSPDDRTEVRAVYRRSKSESWGRRERVETGRLRRATSSMEISKSFKGHCGNCATGLGCYPEDHMSKEEFRKTIEDFISKQQSFLKQEEDFSVLDD